MEHKAGPKVALNIHWPQGQGNLDTFRRSLPQTLLHPEQQQMAALEQLHHLQTALAGSDAGLPDLEELLLPDIDTLLDNRTDEQPGSACHPVLDTDTARIRYSELPQASQWPGSFERGDSAGSSLTSVVRGISTAQEEQDSPQRLVNLSFLPRTGPAAGADSREMTRWHSEPNLDAILGAALLNTSPELTSALRRPQQETLPPSCTTSWAASHPLPSAQRAVRHLEVCQGGLPRPSWSALQQPPHQPGVPRARGAPAGAQLLSTPFAGVAAGQQQAAPSSFAGMTWGPQQVARQQALATPCAGPQARAQARPRRMAGRPSAVVSGRAGEPHRSEQHPPALPVPEQPAALQAGAVSLRRRHSAQLPMAASQAPPLANAAAMLVQWHNHQQLGGQVAQPPAAQPQEPNGAPTQAAALSPQKRPLDLGHAFSLDSQLLAAGGRGKSKLGKARWVKVDPKRKRDEDMNALRAARLRQRYEQDLAQMELMQRQGASGRQAAAAAATAEPGRSPPREDSQASDASAAGSTSQQRQLGPPLSETLEASVSTAMLATFRSHNNGGISQPSLNTLESETQALLAQCSAQGPHDWGVAPSVSLNDSLLDDLLVPGLNMGQFDF